MAEQHPEPADGVAVDGIAHSSSTALARAPRKASLIHPLDAGETKAAMQAYQEGLKSILDEGDYQSAEAGKRFVKKSGWRKIATWFSLDVQKVEASVERDEGGRPQRAGAVYRATAPNGRYFDGDGYCAADEFTGQRADSRKMENDMRATATTRAVNRAISNLVGMGEVSAEEVDAGPGDQAGAASGHLKAPAADQARAGKAALAYLLNAGEAGAVSAEVAEAAGATWKALAEAIGRKAQPPAIVVEAWIHTAEHLRDLKSPTGAGGPSEGGGTAPASVREGEADEPVDAEVVPDDGEPEPTAEGDDALPF